MFIHVFNVAPSLSLSRYMHHVETQQGGSGYVKKVIYCLLPRTTLYLTLTDVHIYTHTHIHDHTHIYVHNIHATA